MKGLRLGDSASISRVFSDSDRASYRRLAGEVGDKRDEHGYRLPEPLIGGLFSFILGTDLPGFGTNYLKQRMRFLKPAYFGEPLTATVTVSRLRPDKQLVYLQTRCHDGAGELVCSGEALVLAKDVQQRAPVPP